MIQDVTDRRATNPVVNLSVAVARDRSHDLEMIQDVTDRRATNPAVNLSVAVARDRSLDLATSRAISSEMEKLATGNA